MVSHLICFQHLWSGSQYEKTTWWTSVVTFTTFDRLPFVPVFLRLFVCRMLRKLSVDFMKFRPMCLLLTCEWQCPYFDVAYMLYWMPFSKFNSNDRQFCACKFSWPTDNVVKVCFFTIVDESYVEDDLLCLLNTGEVCVFTVPSLRRQIVTNTIGRDNVLSVFLCFYYHFVNTT